MDDDELRFGDVSEEQSGGPVGRMEMVLQLAVQALVLLVILYVGLSMADTLFFDGAIPFV